MNHNEHTLEKFLKENRKWMEPDENNTIDELKTCMTKSENKLTAMNKLIDQRDSFVGGFLRNPKTMGIVVHSHKMNTQDPPNFVKCCIAVNIFHRTSMISAMGPMVMMVMTKLFRRTHRDGRAKKG